MQPSADIFNLPIAYRTNYPVPASMQSDLELLTTVDATVKPMYEALFRPKTILGKRVAHKWGETFTDDAQFLTDSVALVRATSFPVHDPTDFLESWDRIRDTEDFTTVFQYIEQKPLLFLNTSPKFLTVMSVYSMTSPVLFLLSPLLIAIAPYVILKSKNMPVSWSDYKEMLSKLLKSHAIGSLFVNFGSANMNQRMGMIMSAIFFGVQLYSNVQACFTFFKNIRYVHLALKRARDYIGHILETTKILMLAAPATYREFIADLTRHQLVLTDFYLKLQAVRAGGVTWTEIYQLGFIRQLFYQIRTDEALRAAIEYSFGVFGYAENLTELKAALASKRISACKFGKETKFTKAVYAPSPSNRPNSYALKNYAITGPNASGKTTFIKMTMLNVLFSQQVGMGFYRRATICPYQNLCCYLNIPDTSGRDSLFQAEARRCKEIIDAIGDTRMLCIFDELFSGTNPAEASASAYAFLKYLETKPQCTFLLTTHFLDVCQKIDPTITNMHMETETHEGKLLYKYKFSKGISRVQGGVRVLEDLGYPDSILACAKAC